MSTIKYDPTQPLSRMVIGFDTNPTANYSLQEIYVKYKYDISHQVQ